MSSLVGARDKTDSNMLVTKKIAAKTIVARVKAFPAPRADMKLPDPPPMPSAPPSERCKRTTPIRAIQMKMWNTSTMLAKPDMKLLSPEDVGELLTDP